MARRIRRRQGLTEFTYDKRCHSNRPKGVEQCISLPPSLSPPERSLKVLKLSLLRWHLVYTHHVKPHGGCRLLRKLPYVPPRQPAQHIALVLIHSSFRRSHIVSRTCLHFDEAQH